jgi:hypothetical protein
MKKIDPAVGEVVLQGFLRLHQAHLLRTEGRGASLLRLQNFFIFFMRHNRKRTRRKYKKTQEKLPNKKQKQG